MVWNLNKIVWSKLNNILNFLTKDCVFKIILENVSIIVDAMDDVSIAEKLFMLNY